MEKMQAITLRKTRIPNIVINGKEIKYWKVQTLKETSGE